ncbi:hypothetical protein C9278_07555, partial [Escherichia coli]
GKTSIFSHPVYLFLREFSLQDFRGGSVYIRTLLFHGAKTVSNARKGRQVQESWLGRPVSRRNKNVATVALNNKNARVLWVLLTNDKEISPEEVMVAAYM